MVFLVECKPERILVKTLTSTANRNIIHSGGKSNVIIDLAKRYEDSKGVVDEDPGNLTPRSFQRFREVNSFEEHSLKILLDKERKNHLVILRPRLEEWILKAAKESRVNVKKYGLPDDPLRLHDIINVNTDRFEELIEGLKRSKQLTLLREILTSYPITEKKDTS